jgi:glycosyltransferase involved in cell wall biosynthesis
MSVAAPRDLPLIVHVIATLDNGFDTAKFRPPEASCAVLRPGFADEGSFVIGTVRRMAEIKDPLTLVRAFQAFYDAVGVERRRKLRLVMVGDGPLREDVNRALAGTPACDVTWLPGRRDDIAEIMRGLDLFVLPSRNEGISNTIFEAMATGLRVLASAETQSSSSPGGPARSWWRRIPKRWPRRSAPPSATSRWSRRTALSRGSACSRNRVSAGC